MVYEAFEIMIVDELPAAGEENTFYLVPKENGNGYDKYWYITDSVGNHTWDVFGGSSTVVVDALPEVGEEDVDYILKSNSGYLYYKYIDGFWQIVAGSLAYIGTALPDVTTGSEFTDYYIVNPDNGTYTHYRFINGNFHVIGGDSYTKEEVNAKVSAVSDGLNETITSDMLANRTITAVYTKTPRTYTVTWYSRAGLSLGSVTTEYGSEVVYEGDTPTNDTEEGTYIYNVFAGWNKSTGFITEDTDVYAIWERAELPTTDKDLMDMTPGEIYAVTASGRTANYFVDKDYIDIKLGHDFEFENVESEVLAEDRWFDGKTAIDTDITLFGENDRSFTMAIDFELCSLIR